MPQTEIRTNERGEILGDAEKFAEMAAEDSWTRYNGGWVKSVTGLDQTRTNGYSLIGEFVRGTIWLKPGLYVDCSIGGSRKNQHKTYHLFELMADGSARLIQMSSGADWATRLWSTIETWLANSQHQQTAKGCDRAALEVRRAALLEELAEIETRLNEVA